MIPLSDMLAIVKQNEDERLYVMKIKASTNDDVNTTDNRPIGQTSDGKKFVHLGGGILMGCDENGKGLLENSDNQIIAAIEVN